MSDPETPTQPLLRGQPVVGVPSPQNGRSSRAYKVAGLTLLACVLIAGQATIAYFLFSQRGDIKTLEEQSNNLKAELTRGRSVSVPMQMHLPMNALPELMDDSVDEEASSTPAARQATECQLEAAGVKAVQVPGFRPSCDERGLYKAQQCHMQQCWCVNPVNGVVVPGSMQSGKASCSTTVLAGGMSKVLALPDIEA